MVNAKSRQEGLKKNEEQKEREREKEEEQGEREGQVAAEEVQNEIKKAKAPRATPALDIRQLGGSVVHGNPDTPFWHHQRSTLGSPCSRRGSHSNKGGLLD